MKIRFLLLLLLPFAFLTLNCNQKANANLDLPSFILNDNSKEITFKEYAKDNVVIVNFWATWCGPCVEEMPDLIELSKKYKYKKVKFVGVSVDEGSDAKELVDEFIKEYKIPYPVVIDKNQSIQKSFGGMRGIPTTFIVGKDGKIKEKLLGLRTKEVFIKSIEKVINSND